MTKAVVQARWAVRVASALVGLMLAARPALAQSSREPPLADPVPTEDGPRVSLGLPELTRPTPPVVPVSATVPGTATPKPSAWEKPPSEPLVLPLSLPLSAPAGLSAPTPAPTPLGSFTGVHTTLPRPVSSGGPVDRPELAVDVEFGPCRYHSRSCLDNLSLFAGLDGARQPADLGINPNFGYRLAVNWGLPLWEDLGIGLQVGTALNQSQSALRLTRFLDGTTERTQSFTSIGLFQRTAWGLNYGFVYDFRIEDYYADIHVGQWRWQAGVDVGRNDEIGVWGTVADRGQNTSYLGVPFTLQPINQWYVFWRHVWPNEITTRVWAGIAEEHGRFNLLVFPPERAVKHPFGFGGEFFVPLTPYLALYGQGQCLMPADSGVLSATIGLAFFPGTARESSRSRFSPLLPLGNNSTFALDLR